MPLEIRASSSAGASDDSITNRRYGRMASTVGRGMEANQLTRCIKAASTSAKHLNWPLYYRENYCLTPLFAPSKIAPAVSSKHC